MTERKTIKLEGEPLQAARVFTLILTEHTKKVQELHDEFQSRYKFLMDAQAAEARSIWSDIVTPHGIDANQSWMLRSWRLDTTYVKEHDAAYLCESEPLPEAMQNLAAPAPAPASANKLN